MTFPTAKSLTGFAGSAVALAATATTPEQVIACALAGMSDAATWLVPNTAQHPRWWRRAAKACVSAAGVGLAAVPLALYGYEGAAGSISVAGLWVQMDPQDWQTLGLLAARTALVALIPNGDPAADLPAFAEDVQDDHEREVIDLGPNADDPLPAADGITVTSVLSAVPAPRVTAADQAAALRSRPGPAARREAKALAAGRHQAHQ